MGPLVRRLCLASGAFAASGAVAYAVLPETSPPKRFSRASIAVARVAADYKFSSDPRPEVHRRSADHLAATFLQLGGIFIKAGQHIASLNHVLPREWVVAFQICQDRAPYRSLEEIRAALDDEYGIVGAVDRYFSRFDPVPLAAASLAQVHYAELSEEGVRRHNQQQQDQIQSAGSWDAIARPGQPLALKVQYPGLVRTCSADLLTISILCRTVEFIFPDFKLGWLVRQFQENLPRELDFLQEMKNCQRSRSLFRHRQDVLIPQVFSGLSTSRVLALEFVHGFRVTDRKSILEHCDMSPKQVSDIVADVVGEQIFSHGFVHADPHPGNLLISRDRQLIILDHGLYVQLTDDFRDSYSRLWISLFLRNTGEVRRLSLRLGVPEDLYPLFASMVSTRSFEHSTAAFRSTISRKEERAFIRRAVQDRLADVSTVLSNVPEQMLLLFKCNDLMRSIYEELGLGVDFFEPFVQHAVDSVAARSHSWVESLRIRWNMWSLLWKVRAFIFWSELWGKLAPAFATSGQH